MPKQLTDRQREIAEQALGLIEVEYEVLPPVLDPEFGASPDAPLVIGLSGVPPDSPILADEVGLALVRRVVPGVVLPDLAAGLERLIRGGERGRVLEFRHLPARTNGAGMQASAVSFGGDVAIKKVHGIATVRDDGSACFTVPANENLFFQALDENYMELQRMRTFINLMPGERRSCIGCHEHRTAAPPGPQVAHGRGCQASLPHQVPEETPHRRQAACATPSPPTCSAPPPIPLTTRLYVTLNAPIAVMANQDGMTRV